MKAKISAKMGDIVAPVSKSLIVSGNKLLLPDGVSITHGDAFNVTLISHFLVATTDIPAGEEIVLNFNLAFYDTVKGDEQVFRLPCVQGFRYLSEEDKQALYTHADECVREAATAEGFVPRGREGEIDVVRSKHKSLVSVCKGDHDTGAVVFESSGVLLPFPVRSTVEVPGDMHLRLTGGSEFIRHSCKPNVRLEISGNLLRGVALRSIENGEKLTFNYLCTEWAVTKPFKCSCNVYCCYGVIKGFAYLDQQQQEHLLPECSTAVREKYQQQLSGTAALPSSVNGSSALAFSSDSRVVAQTHIAAGTVLYASSTSPRVKMDGAHLLIDHLRLPHSCDANTALLEGRLVSCRPLAPGDVLTINTQVLYYRIAEPFACRCGGVHCTGSVSGFHTGLSTARKDELLIFAAREVREQAIADGYAVPSSSPWAHVRSSEAMGQATYATKRIPAGTRVFHVKGLVIPFPTVYTIYIGDGKHLTFADGAHCLAHSCEPNTRIVVDPANGALDCFATTNIAEGELVSFNYLTTEWAMDAPFACACQAPSCFGKIQGYSLLTYEQQLRLWPMATKAIQSLFAQTRRSVSSVLSTLDRSMVEPSPAHATGEVRVTRDLCSGTVLFDAPGAVEIVPGGVNIGDIFLPHSCDPAAAVLEGHVVLCQAVDAGTVVSVNVNQLAYKVENPFPCACGMLSCVGRVAGFKYLDTATKNAVLLCTSEDVRAAAIREDGYHNECSCDCVTVRANGKMGQATFASKPIKAGQRFLHVDGLVLPFPTVYTIQLQAHRHLLFGDGAQCLAHSCDPNVRVMVDAARNSIHCLALRDIAEGEVVSFNYLATEWDMNSPFQCLCNAPGCFGKISGFKHLRSWDRQRIWSMTTPVIKALAERSSVNWKRLSAYPLRTNADGYVCAAQELCEGTPLLTAVRHAVVPQHGCLVVDEITLRHSAAPNAAVIKNQIVLIETVCAGAEIVVDLNCLVYELSPPFVSRMPHEHTVRGFKHLTDEVRAQRLIFTDDAVRTAALRDGMKVPCRCPLVTVKANGAMGQATFAAADIPAGARFFRVPGLCLPFPTVYTIMLSHQRHLLFADGAQCLAHSCDPNVKICVDFVNNTLECEALRPIAAGELISFNYNTTEWDMSTPFTCVCGAPGCVYKIQGFKHLSQRQREAIQPLTTVAVKQLAGQYAEEPLPPSVRANAQGYLVAKESIAPERVVLELFHFDTQPRQISIGKDYAIPHSSDSNCVLVEGRIISIRSLERGDAITVNMNYFVYDLKAMFPRAAYDDDCQGFRYLDDAVKQRQLFLCEPPVRAQAMRDGWLVKSTQTLLTIRPNGGMGQTAYATEDIAAGTRLFHCTGVVVPYPTMYTICVGANRHLLFGDAAECIAHHCDPNVRVDVGSDASSFDFVTVRPIAKGDLVTFNYNTTEYDMNSPFVCLCGSPVCAGKIQGFKYLNNEQRRRLWPITSDVVKSEVDKEVSVEMD